MVLHDDGRAWVYIPQIEAFVRIFQTNVSSFVGLIVGFLGGHGPVLCGCTARKVGPEVRSPESIIFMVNIFQGILLCKLVIM